MSLLCPVLTIILFTCKLLHLINIPWLITLAPMGILFAYWVIGLSWLF